MRRYVKTMKTGNYEGTRKNRHKNAKLCIIQPNFSCISAPKTWENKNICNRSQ